MPTGRQIPIPGARTPWRRRRQHRPVRPVPIGRLHDAQTPDPGRKLGLLRPHDARHTFAFQLSQTSGHNRAELERRLGHANDRYLRLYTTPPDDIAASYIEDL
ncbi:site-specific integrase [Nonomuraea aurantiaca]|uniref:site-specific integrase n=1 Tax=Nonomuraea aurantiaca TaxID=2878562 RepID=UPI001CD99E01|nr:site-specific integrase [Nonomuraea aurantiaca]MCA2230023.1 site-specific integrase [Nonomuraea aurantiaca]